MRRLVLISVVILGLLTAASAQAAKTPGVAWSPSASFDYGTLDAADGGNASQTFTLRNTDGKPTGTLSISLTGSSAFTKTADTCTGTKLSSKRSCSVMVKYAPTANGSDSATLSASAPNTTGASDSLTGASAWQGGDVLTFFQDDWGSGDPTDFFGAAALAAHYTDVYGSAGLMEVGISGNAGFSMLFDGVPAVTAYLPQTSSTVGPLTGDLLDPTSSSSGAFGGEVTTLKLNVDFAAAGYTVGTSGLKLGDLRICGLTSDTDLNGKTLSQFLGVVSTALGGGSTTDPISDLWPLTDEINAAFWPGENNGTPTQPPTSFAQGNLQPGPCP